MSLGEADNVTFSSVKTLMVCKGETALWLNHNHFINSYSIHNHFINSYSIQNHNHFVNTKVNFVCK